MGTAGEVWTAQELRRLRRKGWHLVNGVQREYRGDIDHILVGPGGVLVVETKWSTSRWPVNGRGDTFMQGRMDDAASQAQNNRKAVVDWLVDVAPDVHAISVAVLWSGSPQTGSTWVTWRDRHTVVIPGERFRRWLEEELPKTGVTPDVVNRIRSKLERRVEVQDRQRLEGSGPIPPTLWALVAEWGFKPLCGLIAAVYGLSLTRYATNWPVDLVATVGAVLVGLCACRIIWWRRVSIGWTTYSVFYLVVIVAILVRDTLF